MAFDLDGTLYPNYRFNIRLLPSLFKYWRLLSAFGKARKQLRIEQENQDFPSIYDYQTQKTAEFMRKPADQIKEKIEKFIYKDWDRHFLKIKLFSHVKEVLTEFKAAGLKLAVLSDLPPEKKLKNLGLEGFWDTVLCSEKTGRLKPAARPFIELSNSLKIPAMQILYVGNRFDYDIIGASRAGMKTALIVKNTAKKPYPEGKVKTDFLFNNYRQLYDYVLK